MLCFDVFVNGRRLCRAGLRAGGISVIIQWSSQGRRPAIVSRAGRGATTLDVGGLFVPSEDELQFPKWVSKRLRPGDRITIRMVAADKADRPKKTDVEKREWVEAQRRAFYDRLKTEYESPAATKVRRRRQAR